MLMSLNRLDHTYIIHNYMLIAYLCMFPLYFLTLYAFLVLLELMFNVALGTDGAAINPACHCCMVEGWCTNISFVGSKKGAFCKEVVGFTVSRFYLDLSTLHK